MSTTIMQSLAFIIFTVSEKIASWPFSQPITDHYIDSYFSCESKTHDKSLFKLQTKFE